MYTASLPHPARRRAPAARAWCRVAVMCRWASSRIAATALVVGGLAHAAAIAQPLVVSGSVVDVSGAAIPGATIEAEGPGGARIDARTDAAGRFAIAVAVARIRVWSDGFDLAEAVVTPGVPLTVVLRPATFADSVVVTATRSEERLASAASATVLTSAELANMAAGALDDALRQTPGFTLARRASSRVANPTTQGVTLRGVSGSGASRTLVLADGVPLNDPFGSWVYWNRVPQAAIDRVEVVRGATGDLYGAGALGGVVQVLTVPPDRTRVRAAIDGGSHDTLRASVFGGAQRGGWAGAAAYEGVATAGAYVVAPAARGAVDTRAASDYHTGFITAGRRTGRWHAWGKAAAYTEARDNGTPMQVNATGWSQASADVGALVGGGALQARVAASSQRYEQTFSAVAATRATERLTTEQTTATRHRMASGQWTRPFARVSLVAGGDHHLTDASVAEFRYSLASVRSGPFFAGGAERLTAAYLRATIHAGDAVSIEVGGRGDWWRSEPGDASLPAKSVRVFSPRASAAWHRGRWVVQGAAYRASRTPSLNELHRGFRVGNVVTNPNPLVDPERLTGVEGGARARWDRLTLRATAFLNHLDGAIANITLSATPTLITRMRQNSDAIRAAGLEVEADARLTSHVGVTGQVVFTSSHFRGSVATPAIEDHTVPQVPAVQGAVSFTWADPRWLTVSTQVRASGGQFDDDLNLFRLGAYAVWDAQASRTIARGLQAFVAVENLLDTEYDTARTPQRQIGWPRTVRAGARAAWR